MSSRSIQAALVAIGLFGSNPVRAQVYPAKPIRLIVGSNRVAKGVAIRDR
jgi:hypothetical protein